MFSISNRRYLGSKAKLLRFIETTISENCGEINSFLDLFAGTGNVAWHFNNFTRKIIVNDILESNFVFYQAFFGHQEIDIEKIKKFIYKYNKLKISLEDNYFSHNFSNTYFSDFNTRKIGFIRSDIKKELEFKNINYRESCVLITSLSYAMDRIANTVGHYDAYRLHGDLHKELKLELLELPENGVNSNNEIFREDANALVKKVEADLVYIDPPYNSRQYSDAYHLLENVVAWEKPEVFGVAKKMDRSHIKSKYCTNSASIQFADLIENIRAKYILVSYNNMGSKGSGRSHAKISDDEIISVLQKKGRVEVFETDFNQFSAGKTNIEDHKERLFLCFVEQKPLRNSNQLLNSDEFVKSPLNFTGGKFKLLPQLINRFPNNTTTFIDLFGGGFNVGANANAELYVYNDKQTELVNIIKLFKKYNYLEITKKIEQIIDKFELSSSIVNGYDYYGCSSDSGLGSYNKEKYMELRSSYNKYKKNDDYKSFLLLTLIIFSFNNQIRFNSKNEFNMPVGKRDFNYNIRRNLRKFGNKIQNKEVVFSSTDFSKVNPLNYTNPFVYCDPPYILGLAVYNESEGWRESDELRLLDYLKKLNENGIKFALSNVIEHKGKVNQILKDWIEINKFNLIYINSNYKNSNYQLKHKNNSSFEVLVTNY